MIVLKLQVCSTGQCINIRDAKPRPKCGRHCPASPTQFNFINRQKCANVGMSAIDRSLSAANSSSEARLIRVRRLPWWPTMSPAAMVPHDLKHWSLLPRKPFEITITALTS